MTIDIRGFEKLYSINYKGDVWSYRKNCYLKPQVHNDGVLKVNLKNGNVKKCKAIHRLVGEHFISNPENKPQIDHIDGNKQNNNVINLRWCTNEENQSYRVAQKNTGGRDRNKEVLYGTLKFPSIKALARHIATIRGSNPETVRKELKTLRYGDKTIYGELCKLL